jgi:hypothetical protein
MKYKVIVGGTLLVPLGSSVVWAGDPAEGKAMDGVDGERG